MAPALVQLIDDTDNSGPTSFGITFSSNVTAGNLIVVMVSICKGATRETVGTTITSLTDSLGQTYTQVGTSILMITQPPVLNDDAIASLWYLQNSLGGPCTITVTLSSFADINIGALEYSGMLTSGVLRSTSPGVVDFTTSGVGPTITASSGDLIVAPLYWVAPGTLPTVSLPFTLEDYSFGTSSIFMIDNLNASGSLAAHYDFGGFQRQWGALGASFKPLGSSSSPPATRTLLGVGL